MRAPVQNVALAASSADPEKLPATDFPILSLSCVYPNAADPRLGVFVRSRLERMARLAPLKVIAPVPRIDYARTTQVRRVIPGQERDGQIEVFHPAWIYPPGGYSANAVLLFLRLWPLVASLRKRFPFRVIDAHFGFPDGIAAGLLAARFKVPFSITLRGNETLHAGYPIRRKLMSWAFRRAGRVIVLSSRLQALAVSLGAKPENVKMIPNGVDPDVFFMHDRLICRKKWRIAEGTRAVLSAGSLIERKGHHRVVQALESVRRSGMNAELFIAGGAGREGKYESEIRRQVSELRLEANVHFCGEVSPEQLSELMSAADVLCLASSREGWPNVVHEAMACGSPVVVTDVGAVRDMVPSPDYGIVVDERAPQLNDALYQALTREWNRERISEWAHARTWSRVAAEVVAELRELAGTTDRRPV